MTKEVFIGEKLYNAEIIGERELFINDEVWSSTKFENDGCTVNGNILLTYRQSNEIDTMVDVFEDGGNAFVDGYEVFEKTYDGFKINIRRKAKLLDEVER